MAGALRASGIPLSVHQSGEARHVIAIPASEHFGGAPKHETPNVGASGASKR